jgi:hypothetical protein
MDLLEQELIKSIIFTIGFAAMVILIVFVVCWIRDRRKKK